MLRLSAQYFLGILSDIIVCGLASHFQYKKTLFTMMISDMAAKIKFLQLCENARLKTDLTRENIGKFCANIGI